MTLFELLALALLTLLLVAIITALFLWLKFTSDRRRFVRDDLYSLREAIRSSFRDVSNEFIDGTREMIRDGLREASRDFFPYRQPYDEQLSAIIRSAERRSGIVLTRGARQVLSIPVLETLDVYPTVDWDQINSSIQDVVRTAAEDTDPSELRAFGERFRSSVAIVRGIHFRYCNIPPFCSRRDGELR